MQSRSRPCWREFAAELTKDHPDGGLEPPPSMTAVSNTAAGNEQPEQRRQTRSRAPKKTELQQQAAKSIVDQGVDEALPAVEISPEFRMDWVLDKGEYTLQDGRLMKGVALWAVTSKVRRGTSIPATQLSQLDRADKAPVGLLRAVKPCSDGLLLLELWFSESSVRVAPGPRGAGAADAAVGAGVDGSADAASGGGEAGAAVREQGRADRRKRKRGMPGRRSASSRVAGRSGRKRRLTARGRGFWDPEDEGENLFSDNDDDAPAAVAAETAAAAAAASAAPSQQATAPETAPEQERRPAEQVGVPLHGCLLAETSPRPMLVPDVEMTLHRNISTSASAALLAINPSTIAADMCLPRRVQIALGKASSIDATAAAIALALLLANELNESRARAGDDDQDGEDEQHSIGRGEQHASMDRDLPSMGQRQMAAALARDSLYIVDRGQQGSPSQVDVGAAMEIAGLLSSQVNFSPPSQSATLSAGSAALQEDDEVNVVSDAGSIIGTAVVQKVGGLGATFHFTELGPDMAVVYMFSITNATAAESQAAWMGDGDTVTAGVTKLSQVGGNIFLVVPLAHLRLRQRSSPGD